MNRSQWMLDQLDSSQIEYCEREARKLEAMQLADEETGRPYTYSDWLYTVTLQIYRLNEERRGRYCGEMGDD